MKIYMDECVGTSTGRELLGDIADHETLIAWIADIARGKTRMHPLNASVIVYAEDGRTDFEIAKEGVTNKLAAIETIMKLVVMDKDSWMLPNDSLVVSLDAFESELYIYPCGKPEEAKNMGFRTNASVRMAGAE